MNGGVRIRAAAWAQRGHPLLSGEAYAPAEPPEEPEDDGPGQILCDRYVQTLKKTGAFLRIIQRDMALLPCMGSCIYLPIAYRINALLRLIFYLK